MSLASFDHLRRWTPRRGDLLAAVVIAAPVFGSLAYRAVHTDEPLNVLIAPATLLPIFLRQSRPLVALLLAVAVHSALPDNDAFVLPALAVLCSIALRGTWLHPALAAAGVTVAALIAGAGWGNPNGRGGLLGEVIGTGGLCAAAVAVGLYVGARHRVVEGLRERAERLDREGELLADRAVAEERLRIAQELHDSIAHNVSLMVVQAQGLGATSADEHVSETTGAIAALGRQAMAEMHRTSKLLRADQAEAQLTPQPGLADLDRLFEQSRAAGVEIEFPVEGQPRPLAQSVDLSAFRIVQENVVKHAAGARTTVSLSYEERGLQLAITDDGDVAGRTADPPALGHGLIGMRERASPFGGTLTAEPRSGRGFHVAATLPYSEADS